MLYYSPIVSFLKFSGQIKGRKLFLLLRNASFVFTEQFLHFFCEILHLQEIVHKTVAFLKSFFFQIMKQQYKVLFFSYEQDNHQQ